MAPEPESGARPMHMRGDMYVYTWDGRVKELTHKAGCRALAVA